MELMSFDETLELLGSARKPALLTGNGFSQAWDHTVFAYQSLFKQIDFAESAQLREVFDELDTRDFEVVIEVLQRASQVGAIYGVDQDRVRRMHADGMRLRELLAEVIAGNHPDRPDRISELQFSCCRDFLSHFSAVYTVNYDLLLYWTLMHTEPRLEIANDGFGASEQDPGADYVVWHPENRDGQKIFYLHGALHLFDAGAELCKYTWSRRGVALIDQIREALELRRYPLVVTEGETREKLARIMHSAYLARGLKSLRAIHGPLIIYGHSLAENDEHVLDCIVHGKVDEVAVSLYGDPDSATNRRIRTRAESLVERTNSARSAHRARRQSDLSLSFYSASSAPIWSR